MTEKQGHLTALFIQEQWAVTGKTNYFFYVKISNFSTDRKRPVRAFELKTLRNYCKQLNENKIKYNFKVSVLDFEKYRRNSNAKYKYFTLKTNIIVKAGNLPGLVNFKLYGHLDSDFL